MRKKLSVVVGILALLAPVSLAAQAASLPGAKLYGWGLNVLTETNGRHQPEDSVNYFRQAADLGYAPAQVAMGYFYETGTIVTKEPGQALDWYRKAAQQNDALGEWLLGRMIYTGAGTVRDLNQAGNWFDKAASEHNDPFGQYLSGMIKLNAHSYADAAVLLGKAANQGLPQAQQQLGLLLQQGQGVAANKVQAAIWLQVSADGGNKAAAQDLGSLSGELSSSELEETKSKAHELEGKITRSLVAHGCTGWAGEFSDIPSPPPPAIQQFCR